MGGSTDAFSLYLSIFRVDRPTDASKATTSLAFHKDAEQKFEPGTGVAKPIEQKQQQTELMSYDELKASIDAETEAGKVELATEEVQLTGRAGAGRRLGDSSDDAGAIADATGTEKQGGDTAVAATTTPTLGERREMAVRAAEKRASEAAKQRQEKEGLKVGEVREVQTGRAQPAA